MESQVDRGHRGLPVMRVHDVERQTRDDPDAQRRRRGAETGEANPVVGPFRPVRAEIRIAGTRKEMRRIDDQQIERRGGAAQHPGRTAEQVGESCTATASVSALSTAG